MWIVEQIVSARASARNPEPKRMLQRRIDDTKAMLINMLMKNIRVDVKDSACHDGVMITAILPDNDYDRRKGTEMARIEETTYGSYGTGRLANWIGYSGLRQGELVRYPDEPILPPRTKQNEKPKLGFHASLRKEINEWLKI